MDRGMQMGEVGRVEPVASLPGAARRKIECGDLYFADNGQSSHAYPTLWVVLSSKTALEPGSHDLQGEEAKWYAAHGACGEALDIHRGLNASTHGWPDERAVIYTSELREMAYLGNLYNFAKSQWMARSAPEASSPKGPNPSPSHPSGPSQDSGLFGGHADDPEAKLVHLDLPAPSQDSQEVRAALAELDFRSLAADLTLIVRDHLTPETPANSMQRVVFLEVAKKFDRMATLLSQSPKGAAGAADAFALGQVVDHATERAEKAEAVIRNYRKATFAALKALDEAVKVQLQQALCVDSDYCTEREEAKAAGGESGPSAPKTGLRGAAAPGEAVAGMCGANSPDSFPRCCHREAGHNGAHEYEDDKILLRWWNPSPGRDESAPGDVGEAGGGRA